MKHRLYKAIPALTVFIAAGFLWSSSGPAVSQAAYADTLAVAAFGSSTDTGEPCADLPCNGGDTCDCAAGNVEPTMTFGSSGGPWPVSSVNYELSVDETVTLNDGTNTGKCMPATGKGVITLKDKSTIDFVMSGLDCTVPGIEPHGLFDGTMRLDGGTYHHGRLRGLGSIKIGDIGADTKKWAFSTTEVVISVAVDASGGFQ